MAEVAVKAKAPENAAEAKQELTDGFHLVIDALKLNGLHRVDGPAAGHFQRKRAGGGAGCR